MNAQIARHRHAAVRAVDDEVDVEQAGRDGRRVDLRRERDRVPEPGEDVPVLLANRRTCWILGELSTPAPTYTRLPSRSGSGRHQ
jgi:hypothetical protein